MNDNYKLSMSLFSAETEDEKSHAGAVSTEIVDYNNQRLTKADLVDCQEELKIALARFNTKCNVCLALSVALLSAQLIAML